MACVGLFKTLMPLQTLKSRWFHIKVGLPSLPEQELSAGAKWQLLRLIKPQAHRSPQSPPLPVVSHGAAPLNFLKHHLALVRLSLRLCLCVLCPLTPSGVSTDTVRGSGCSEDLQPAFSQRRGPEASYLCSQFSMMKRPYLPKRSISCHDLASWTQTGHALIHLKVQRQLPEDYSQVCPSFPHMPSRYHLPLDPGYLELL